MSDDGTYSNIKFHLTALQQVSLLQARGMVVSDENSAQKTLLSLGYYRFAGYFYAFRKTNPRGTPGRQDEFQDGTSFEIVEQLCEFDRRLRLLILEAAACIEVAVRCDIAHRLGKQHRIAHEQASLLDANFCLKIQSWSGKTRYAEWKEKLAIAVDRAKKEDFIKHHASKYGGQIPIWAIIEVWDFGLLSKFFAGMQFKDQSYIARRYGLQDGRYLESWLRSINFVRNVSAHHSRLWNRNIVERPKFQPHQPHEHLFHLTQDEHAQTRVYGSLCILKSMLKIVLPHSDWTERLRILSKTFPQNPITNLQDAGFPTNWEQKSIWK